MADDPALTMQLMDIPASDPYLNTIDYHRPTPRRYRMAEEEKAPTPPAVEEAQKVEQEDEKLGGDSAPVSGETEVHRPEHDRDVKVPESGVPSPSVR